MHGRKRTAGIVMMMLLLPLFGGCAKPVTLYTDAYKHDVQQLVEPFTKQTGIPVAVIEYFNPVDLVDSIAKDDGGKYVKVKHQTLYNYADVVFSRDIMTGEVLKTRDILQPYAPDAAAGLPAGVKRDDWWYGMGGKVCVFMWNTGLLRGPAPDSLLGLAAPSLPEGSVSLINPNYMLYYYSGACAKTGRDAMVTFLKTMIDRKTQWEAGPEQTAAKVAAGEAVVCLTTLAEAEKQKKGGAPVAWCVPDQGKDGIGAYLQYNTVCIPSVSTMPEQGRKLADYLLSPEAEALSVKLGLSDATLRPCGSEAPVVLPLDTNLATAQASMQNDLSAILPYFTKANPNYKGK